MFRCLCLALVLQSGVSAADAPIGTYVLDEPAESILKGVRPKPICGPDADAYFKSYSRRVEIVYTAARATLNSRTWKIVAASNDSVLLEDPELPKDVRVTAVFGRNGTKAMVGLEYTKLTDRGVEYCRSLLNLLGRHTP